MPLAGVAPPLPVRAADPQTFLTPSDLRLLRQVRGWSLAELGRRVGCDASHLCRIEQGQMAISTRLGLKLVRALVRGEATTR